jgi:hypothetical protein
MVRSANRAKVELGLRFWSHTVSYVALLRTPAAGRALAARPHALRDAYHYEIVLVPSDGHTHRLVLNAADGGGEIERVVPGLGAVVRWIDAEAQRIREQRLKSP